MRRALLLASVVAGFATPAFANDATVGGVPIPVGPGFNLSPIAIWVPLPAETTVVNVDTEDLNGGIFNGVWVTAQAAPTTVTVATGRSVTSSGWGVAVSSTTGAINVVNNGHVDGGLVGIYGFGAYAGDGGNINISGTGTVTSAFEGIRAEVDTGSVNINGFSAINGGTYGVRVLPFGTTTWTGNPSGDFNIGTTTRLGAVTSGGAGIATAMLNTFGEGNTTIRASSVTAGNVGIWSTATTGNIDIDTSGAINAGTEGILAGTTSGNIRANSTGQITAGTYGMRLGSVLMSGNITANSVNINSSGVGIATQTFGTTSVSSTGTINSTNTGIWTIAANGNTTVNANNVSSTANYGIYSTSFAGNNTISTTGTIRGATNGIAVASTSGNNMLTGNGTSNVTGGVEGIYVNPTTSGNATISNFASITGARAGIWSVVGTGITSIQGNGPITGNGNYGILSGSLGGAINIGNTTTNAAITGANIGIDARTIGAGNINLTTDRNVTGNTTWGAYLGTVNGNITSNINGGTISGVTRGFESQVIGSGNVVNSIAAGATVQATGALGSAYGYLTGVTGGTATTNNAGLIRNANDTGAASLAGGDAIWHYFGAGTVNNTGRIVGRVHSNGSTQFTLNNLANGIWTTGNGIINNFGGASDTVNNSGLINVRTGATLLTGLERLNNNSGGIIDLTYGGTQATNTLWTSGNFAPGAGSTIRVAFSTALANNSGMGTDSSSNGKGTADTILAATVSPASRSNINLTTVGSVDSLIGTSGSVAVVQGAVILGNPGMGAVGTFTPSSRYALLGDPTTGAVRFNLTDASDGGVFLQWAPNITSATMGAFGGGDMSSKGGKGSAIGTARSGVTGASSVSNMLGGLGASAGAGTCQSSERRTNLWTTLEAGGSSYDGGASGSNFGGALGWEGQIGRDGDDCAQSAIGLFAYGNSGKTEFSTGKAKVVGGGVGTYFRTVSSNGFYASLLGTAGTVDSKLTNNIFQSTAKSDALGLMADATVGVVRSLGGKAKIDLRGSVSYLSLDAGAFTDTKGITVKKTTTELLTVAGSIGAILPSGENGAFYIRGGARYSHMQRMTNAYDVIIEGSAGEIAGTGEAGFNTRISNSASLDIAAYGDVSKSTTNYGGRVTLRVAF